MEGADGSAAGRRISAAAGFRMGAAAGLRMGAVLLSSIRMTVPEDPTPWLISN